MTEVSVKFEGKKPNKPTTEELLQTIIDQNKALIDQNASIISLLSSLTIGLTPFTTQGDK